VGDAVDVFLQPQISDIEVLATELAAQQAERLIG